MNNVNHSSMIDFLLSVQDLEGLSDQCLQNLIAELDTEDRLVLQRHLIQLIFKLKPLIAPAAGMEHGYAVH